MRMPPSTDMHAQRPQLLRHSHDIQVPGHLAGSGGTSTAQHSTAHSRHGPTLKPRHTTIKHILACKKDSQATCRPSKCSPAGRTYPPHPPTQGQSQHRAGTHLPQHRAATPSHSPPAPAPLLPRCTFTDVAMSPPDTASLPLAPPPPLLPLPPPLSYTDQSPLAQASYPHHSSPPHPCPPHHPLRHLSHHQAAAPAQPVPPLSAPQPPPPPAAPSSSAPQPPPPSACPQPPGSGRRASAAGPWPQWTGTGSSHQGGCRE